LEYCSIPNPATAKSAQGGYQGHCDAVAVGHSSGPAQTFVDTTRQLGVEPLEALSLLNPKPITGLS